jgi:pyruvate/2-oxoglutarate dehydrogenase complex dihydrolipoamide acyltransferase (E2) component
MFGGKHRRVKSDVIAGWPMFGSSQRSGDQRGSGANSNNTASCGLISPGISNTKRISEPKLADAEVQQKMSADKISCLRIMLEQVQQECESMKAEYDRNPTENNHNRYEQKYLMMQRLKTQLTNPKSPSVGDQHLNIFIGDRSTHEAWSDSGDDERRRSLDGEHLTQKAGSYGLPPHPPNTMPPPATTNMPATSTGSQQKRHRKNDSMSAVIAMRAIGSNDDKKDVSLSRSHSDSYRRARRIQADDSLRQAASNDELQNLQKPAATSGPGTEPGSSSFASSASSDSIKHPMLSDATCNHSKSQELGCASDDNANDTGLGGANEFPLSPVNEQAIRDSIFADADDDDNGSGKRQHQIMCLDDDDLTSEDENVSILYNVWKSSCESELN